MLLMRLVMEKFPNRAEPLFLFLRFFHHCSIEQIKSSSFVLLHFHSGFPMGVGVMKTLLSNRPCSGKNATLGIRDYLLGYMESYARHLQYPLKFNEFDLL